MKEGLRRMRTKVMAILAAVLIAAGIATALPARGQADQVCDRLSGNQPAGECFNAWNGGSDVKSYTPNTGNDNFNIEFVSGRCQAGSDLTTANCPISGVPAGLSIIQVVYENTGLCVGDTNDESGNATAEDTATCNDPNHGFGGGYGTIFVIANVCQNNFFAMANAHWSTGWSSGTRFVGYTSPGHNGQQFYLNQFGGSNESVCWLVF